MQRSDQALLNQIQTHDATAFELFYDRYRGLIHRHILAMVREAVATEDLVQEVFLRVWTRAEQWDDVGTVKAWLYRIAHNIVIDHYRQRDRHKDVGLEESGDLIAEHDNPAHQVEMRLTGERLRFAMRQLTEDQSEVLALRFMEGYSISEVAEMMNKTEGAIKALQYGAVANLRSLLEHEQLHH